MHWVQSEATGSLAARYRQGSLHLLFAAPGAAVESTRLFLIETGLPPSSQAWVPTS